MHLSSSSNYVSSFFLRQSREYKYNGQVFDINARLWTEKYASPAAVAASGWGSVDAGVLVNKHSTFVLLILCPDIII